MSDEKKNPAHGGVFLQVGSGSSASVLCVGYRVMVERLLVSGTPGGMVATGIVAG
jgi:hypothetical protein